MQTVIFPASWAQGGSSTS